MNKIKQKLNKISKKISQLLAEIIIVIGLFFIVITTFLINYIIGMYLIGFLLLLVGLFIAYTRK